MEKSFKDQVAVVTGSTRGIGFSIAEHLAAEGAHVVINAASSQAAIDAAVKKLPGGMDRHLGVRGDVSCEQEVRALAKEVEKRFGRCDLLVNNAAFTKFIPHRQLEDLTEAIFDQTLSVNLKGPFLMTRALLSLLQKSPAASIINIASIAAQTGIGSSVAYCASKAGVVTMTRSLARALAPNIRVNSISPGLVDTELTKNFDPKYREEVVSKTPLKRLITSDEIAKTVVALVKEMPSVTGHDFVVDGGYLWRY